MGDVVEQVLAVMRAAPTPLRRKCVVTPSMLALENEIHSQAGRPLVTLPGGVVSPLLGIAVFVDDRYDQPTLLDYDTYMKLRRERDNQSRADAAGVPGECQPDPAGGTVGHRGDDPQR